MSGAQPTRAEIKALSSFCDAERQLLHHQLDHRAEVKAMCASRKQALAAVLQLMEQQDMTCVALPDDLRDATGAKFVRTARTHSTKDLSEKFVRAVITSHFDDIKAAVHDVDNPERLSSILRDVMWDMLKRERITYRQTVQFSNNKPRTVDADAVSVQLPPPLKEALHAMHGARQAIDGHKRRTNELKARVNEEKDKHLARVTSYMERANLDAQTIETGDGAAYTLKYTTMHKTMPLTVDQCQEAINAAVAAFLNVHRDHLQGGGTLSGGYLEREQGSMLDLLVSELQQRRTQTQKKVMRLLKKKVRGEDNEDDDEDEDGDGDSDGRSDE